MVKLKLRSLLPLFLITLAIAEESSGQARYTVFFTDKGNSPYSISNPLDYLSQRAIDRRNAQSISIDSTDLPVSPLYLNGVINTGASVIVTSRWFNAVTVWATGSQISQINSLPYVSGSLEVGRVSGPGKNKFRDEKFGTVSQSANNANKVSSFNYGSSFNQVSMLNGHLMHDNGYTGNGLVIAVLDAGFLNVDNMACFDSLFNDNRLLSTFDFVDPGSSVYDDDSHGAMVLSAMASILPGDMIGTAPHASYHLLRSEDATSENIIEEYNWASAAEYADSAGADIINSSLGYTEFDDPTQNHTYNDLDGNTTPVAIAASMAASKGMVVVNSAGNEGDDPWFHISSPGDADGIITAAAVDPGGAYVQFSGKGPTVDGRVKPDVAAQGAQTVVVEPWTGLGNATITANGTSFSAPLLAGMVACLWECNPSASAQQIISAIQQSGNQSNSPDSLLGYGIPDMTQACITLNAPGTGINNYEDMLFIEGNPVSGTLSFSVFTRTTQSARMHIYDIKGRKVMDRQLDLSGLNRNSFVIGLDLSDGTYTINVITENGTVRSRFIVATY